MRSFFSSNGNNLKPLLVVGAALFVLTMTITGRSISLADYNENLATASSAAGDLRFYAQDRIDGEDADKELEDSLIQEIREALPPTQVVEFDGLEVTVDNRWAEALLTTYLDPSTDLTNRGLTAAALDERIGSLAESVEGLLGPKPAGASKDEDKNKLAEILRRAEFQKPEARSESFFARLLRWIKEWLGQKFPNQPRPEVPTTGLQTLSLGLQIVLYVLVAGFIGFLLYRFAPFLFQRFKGRKKKQKKERVILGERLTADQDSSTLFDEAESLARGGDLRAAIRKGYIAFLCELSDRRVIGLAQHKTNRDYLRDVRTKEALYRNMNGLTNRFERHWYGLDAADEKDWTEFKETYQQTLKSEN